MKRGLPYEDKYSVVSQESVHFRHGVFLLGGGFDPAGDAGVVFWKAVQGMRAIIIWMIGLAASALISGLMGFVLGACFHCGKER